MTENSAGFRAVLHEWAARQLEERSAHVGPFEITRVEMEQTSGSSISDSETWVHIGFRHDGSGCPDSEKVFYRGGGTVLLDRCQMQGWMMPDTRQTIDMLNELLAIANER